MGKKQLTALAVLIGLASIATPILISINFARTQGLDIVTDRAWTYARDVQHRSDRAAVQIYEGIDKLVQAGAGDPCSDENLLLMRQIDLVSSQIQSVGYVEGDNLMCSSLGRHDPGLPLGPVGVTTSTGSAVRTNVVLPFASGFPFTVIVRDSYAAIIHTDLPIDTTTNEQDVSLATFTPDNGSVRSSRGYIKQEWIDTVINKGETSFVDDRYVIAGTLSSVYATGVIAAMPIAYLDSQVVRFAMLLVPVGLLSGLVLTFVMFYLARQQLALKSVLKYALKRNEFFVNYQPVVELATGKWVGAEVLIRWRRPNGEMVRPDLFIPVAEDNGLIQKVTEKVVGLVTAEAPEILRINPDFHVAINLSSADMQSRSTVELFERLTRTLKVNSSNVIVEATERGFFNTVATTDVLKELRKGGIRVAIDDFGTGYSSLTSLEKLELDYLKIDKSFVDTIAKGAATSQVVLHIIEMAKSLQLEIIAEGVETEEQARFLRERGVHYAQGWLFGKPMPVAELLQKLSKA